MLLTHLHSSAEESDQELASHSYRTPDLCEPSSTPPTHESSCEKIRNKKIKATSMNIAENKKLVRGLSFTDQMLSLL